MKKNINIGLIAAMWSVFSLSAGWAAPSPKSASGDECWSPASLVASPDGDVLYVACATAGQVVVFKPGVEQVSRVIAVPDSPLGLAITPDGGKLYVTCASSDSTVCIVDIEKGEIEAKIPAGHTTMAPVLSPDGSVLYVCNRFNNDVAFVDLSTRRITKRVKVPREPIAAAITPDGRYLLVANHIHAGRADVDVVASSVSVIDTAQARVTKQIELPNGSGLLHDVSISPDGNYAFVAHQISRFHLPTTQVERGWVNTSAVSLIGLDGLKLINTVLLDNINSGAANPWAVAWSPDGETFCVTHAGTHELSVVNFPALLAKLKAFSSTEGSSKPVDYSVASRTAADVPNDLSFLVGLRRRIKLDNSDRGPRALAIVGTRAYLANYFSDSLSVIDLGKAESRPRSIPLRPATGMDVVRRGEMLFNDGTICFQGWQSCSSCHSSDARVDGLNWDNLNDGIGNPKNAKSLLLAHQTPPSMWLGVRADAYVSVRAGIRNSMFTLRPEEDAVAIDKYLKSLRPIPSPHLVNGRLSAAAERGKRLFTSEAVGCSECHKNEFYTDMKPHNVGTMGEFRQPKKRFDTPSLIEIWRTGPYLHDGRAATLRDVVTTFNLDNLHGATTHLTSEQVDDLVEFILSL